MITKLIMLILFSYILLSLDGDTSLYSNVICTREQVGVIDASRVEERTNVCCTALRGE